MKAEKRQLWILAGGNGAGKSTFYRTQLAPLGLPFINADTLARELYPETPEEHSYDAAQIAATLRTKMIHEGRSFCFETVFSHPSKVDFVAEAKALGYEVVLIFIHLDNITLNKARVAQRVHEGGHTVPDEKIASRIPRVLQQVKAVLPLCDHVRILNNSSAENPFQQVATIRNGHCTIQQPLPEWATDLLR